MLVTATGFPKTLPPKPGVVYLTCLMTLATLNSSETDQLDSLPQVYPHPCWTLCSVTTHFSFTTLLLFPLFLITVLLCLISHALCLTKLLLQKPLSTITPTLTGQLSIITFHNFLFSALYRLLVALMKPG